MIQKINNALLSLQQSIYTDWLKAFLLMSCIVGLVCSFVGSAFVFIKTGLIVRAITKLMLGVVITIIASLCISVGTALYAVVFFRYIPRLSALIAFFQTAFAAFELAVVLFNKYGTPIALSTIGIFLVIEMAEIVIVMLTIKNMNKRLALQNK